MPAKPMTPAAQSRPAAQALEQELHDFSYMVSHDLAASFRHVSEFSRLLLGDLEDGLSERQKLWAEHIQRANANCQAMLEQLLTYSRAQQRPLRLSRKDATGTARLAMFKLAAAIEATGAEVQIAPLAEIEADHDLLAQAFQHLLDNAIKFHPPNSTPRWS